LRFSRLLACCCPRWPSTRRASLSEQSSAAPFPSY
jgi:hypothetical protein